MSVLRQTSRAFLQLRGCTSCCNSLRRQSTLRILGQDHVRDGWTNVPESVVRLTERKLHLEADHPLGILRSHIEAQMPSHLYAYYNLLPAVVSVRQNFDSLGFPSDHVGRSKSDTYYVDAHHVLRTHTSAHQVDLFRECDKPGFLVAADVYRRDEIDRSHYPVFHQMEGARRWRVPRDVGLLVREIEKEVEGMAKLEMVVEDDNPPFHPDRNPIQRDHNRDLAVAVAKHLKRTLEHIAVGIFGAAKDAKHQAARAAGLTPTRDEPLRVRWIEAYFPFTSPSWELEVLWEGEWLELCGCGVTTHEVMTRAGRSDEIAWAFGLGLERLAMVLFGVPDIRLFWSLDKRFLSQFSAGKVSHFKPFSKYPPNIQDVSFWVPADTKTGVAFQENDLMEVVRDEGGDLVETVKLVDKFEQPAKNRESRCYRITYRSMERSLSNEEIGKLQDRIRQRLAAELGVELR
ncbi:hypothetical protein PYCC9005_005288 [Savitreella phatthalungensis]